MLLLRNKLYVRKDNYQGVMTRSVFTARRNLEEWKSWRSNENVIVITTVSRGGKIKPSVVNNFTRPGWMIKPRPESCSVSRRIHSTRNAGCRKLG